MSLLKKRRLFCDLVASQDNGSSTALQSESTFGDSLDRSIHREFDGSWEPITSEGSGWSLGEGDEHVLVNWEEKFKEQSLELVDQKSLTEVSSYQSTEGTDSLIRMTKMPSLSSASMSSEEKMVSQLKTYLILSKTLGPSYVLKQEKRKHIFEAIRLYHDNKNIAQISVNLLELLVDKTQDKEVFSEIMENFGNIAALVSTNKTDVVFSRNFISLVAKITEKDKTVIQQLNDLAYERTFLEIQNQHVKNKHIQDLFEIISDILGIKKRIMKIKPEPQ